MIEELLKEIGHLQDAKKLLDRILSNYNIYSKEFEIETEEEFQNSLKKARIREDLKRNIISESEQLNTEIRRYLNFDDSE